MADNKVQITQQGKEDIERRLEELKEVIKPRVLSDLNLARSQGDLSENADYDAALNKLHEVDAEINRLQDTLDHAEIIAQNFSNDVCRLGGGKITIRRVDNGKESSFTIVGSAEAAPLEGRISNTCPVALAVLGHKVGDEVVVEVEKKAPYSIVILEINKPEIRK